MNPPSRIELLISDVDGTLVTNEKVLTEAAKTAVCALGDAGIGFTVTSSRPPRGLRMLIEPLNLILPIAGFNGGLIVNPDFSVIESHPIDLTTARQAADLLSELGLDVWVYGEDQWFVLDAGRPHVAREAWILGFDPTLVTAFTDEHLTRSFKIVGVCDDEERMAAAGAAAQTKLGERASATRSAAYFLDVTHPKASKARVVDALTARLNIAPQHVATIGDMPNDVLMFNRSGVSFAMGNASDAVKRTASAVTDSNENDGFAKAVRSLLLAVASTEAKTFGRRRMTPRVREILSWYGSDSPGTLTNLSRLLNHGRLGGTGKLVILPVDQGFEHGPARSFAANPPAYDPRYHFELAIEAGCNAYAAPLGFLEAGAREFAGEIPLILKTNDADTLLDEKDPQQALTSSVHDALRLGCVAVGFTIYPGSAHQVEMFGQLRAYAEEAKRCGLAVVVWSYPRGSGLSKEGESAIDVVGYAAQIAAQLGAHIIKVKLPTDHVEQDAARKVYQEKTIPIATAADRVRHVMQCAFAGRRIVIFSGGAATEDSELFDEVRAIREGGGFGSIIGRNSFQRGKADALKMLKIVMEIHAGSFG